MPTTLTELLSHLDKQLQPGRFRDYCPNGLQVQGRPEVARLVTGVTACQALIDAAISVEADAILVHHGYFWRGEDPCVTGMKRRRLAALLTNDISLIAYHLPLDAHPALGNNACFGRLLGIESSDLLAADNDEGVGNIGSLPEATPISALIDTLATTTGRQPLHIGPVDASVQRIAWCTGAAQGYIEAAVAAGAQVFITGEASEQTVHIAREEGIHFLAAGHHATERYGVQAVGEDVARQFGIEHHFVDIDNPV
ncbi:MAG: Nif3-like dinuclear metal center hexameric protein [Halieaceae bacterium]